MNLQLEKHAEKMRRRLNVRSERARRQWASLTPEQRRQRTHAARQIANVARWGLTAAARELEREERAR